MTAEKAVHNTSKIILHLYITFAYHKLVTSQHVGCLKNLLYSREQYIVVSPFNIVFSGCLTSHVINAAKIVLFKSTIKLNNFS